MQVGRGDLQHERRRPQDRPDRAVQETADQHQQRGDGVVGRQPAIAARTERCRSAWMNSVVWTRLTTKYPMPKSHPSPWNASGMASAMTRKPAMPVSSSVRRCVLLGAIALVSQA